MSDFIAVAPITQSSAGAASNVQLILHSCHAELAHNNLGLMVCPHVERVSSFVSRLYQSNKKPQYSGEYPGIYDDIWESFVAVDERSLAEKFGGATASPSI